MTTLFVSMKYKVFMFYNMFLSCLHNATFSVQFWLILNVKIC